MREPVRGDEAGQIDTVFAEHPTDESDTFGAGDRVGKAPGEAAVKRELHDAVLGERIWADVRLIVVESGWLLRRIEP